MLALEGYYDGHSIKTVGEIKIEKNQRVIVTILDEFVQEAKKQNNNKKTARGILSKYANPSLMEQEEGAFERIKVQKYENN